MALRDVAEYEFAHVFARVIVNNPDGSSPDTSNVLSAVGPFDFSGASAIAAVPVKVKVDNVAEISATVDLSAAVDPAAVTVAELSTAWAAIAIATGLTGAASGSRFKLSKTVVGSTKYLQVYGEFAELAGFGYGYGAVIVKVDTLSSLPEAPTEKASERLGKTDSNGKDTAVITDGYRTGCTITLNDLARDQQLRAVIEGGAYDATAKTYQTPTSSSTKPTFTLERFSAKYEKDDNIESNLVGYVQKISKSCKGTFGEIAGTREIQERKFTIAVTPYRDPATGTRYPDTEEKELTVAAYTTLDVKNV